MMRKRIVAGIAAVAFVGGLSMAMPTARACTTESDMTIASVPTGQEAVLGQPGVLGTCV